MSKTWEKALEILRNRIDPTQFETWLSPIRPQGGDDGALLLEVPDEFFARWVRDNYLEQIKDALWDSAKRHVGIDFKVREAAVSGELPLRSQESAGLELDRLVPRFTFDTFEVGPSNEVAHSACELVARRPGEGYNPLFIHGGVGLGKTHLLHGVGHAVRGRFPQSRVLYTYGESFVNEVMTAVKNGRLDQLRYRYRGQCDLLLMDDIQYLAGREFAQEEFFHTFNELYNAGKQIVVTSDQAPTAIPKVSERLRSRFQWGLIVDIAPPEHELRLKIVLQKAARAGTDLPMDVAEFLATRFPASVRELEGALNRVTAHALIRKVPLTVDLARRVTDKIVTDLKGRITPDLVIKAVAEYFHLQPVDLKSPRRHAAVSGPRQIAMHILRHHTDLSLPAIGEAFGGRSHSTVLASLKHIQDLMASEPATERAVKDIIRGLGL